MRARARPSPGSRTRRAARGCCAACASPRPEAMLHVVRRRVGEQDLALLEGALADEALAHADAPAVRCLAVGGVAREQREVRELVACRTARRTPRAARSPPAPAPTGSGGPPCSGPSGPAACGENLARLVFSQSCSVFFCVVSRRLRIISLMVSFSAATSPLRLHRDAIASSRPASRRWPPRRSRAPAW